MNPIRAKMEKKLFEYKWTSHGKYIGIDKNSPTDCEYVFSLFGEDTKTAIPVYEKYLAKARIFKKVRVE